MGNYLLGLYEKSMPDSLTLSEKLRETKKAGFDYMELSIDETDEKLARLNWGDKEIREMITAMNDEKTPVKSICLSGQRRFPLGDPEHGIQSLEIVQKAVVLASKLGVRIIQIAGYDVYYKQSCKETHDTFLKNLELSVHWAAREGVILAFETMETEFINTVKKAYHWIDIMKSPYLQIYPDIGNITNASVLYGTNVLEDLETGKGHIAAAHLKETKPGIFREIPYGTGHVDFPAAAAKLLQLGVRMFVGEFWYVGEKCWCDVLKHNNTFLRDAINKGEALAGIMGEK